MNDLLKTILLGILEGITEFIPVSSTGHLFLAQHFMGVAVDDSPQGRFWKAFAIVIQIGAILAVVIYFRQRIIDLLFGGRAGLRAARGMTPLEISQSVSRAARDNAVAAGGGAAAACDDGDAASGSTVAGPGLRPMSRVEVAASDARLTPAQRWHIILMVLLGATPILLVGKLIEPLADYLEKRPVAIALALVLGGIAMFIIEKLPAATRARRTERMADMTWKQAMVIGLTQILAAVFPGTSRSAATIMPGLAAGLSRPAAAEFSFFVAIPVMFAACGYKLLKWIRDNRPDLDHLLLLGVGTVVSFMVAWVVIAGFMSYIRRHTFTGFALYRISFGLAALVWAIWFAPGK